jgi:ribonuclease R
MFGTIELHGSRLMFKWDGVEMAESCYDLSFLPYDRVRKEGGTVVLHKRRPQSAIGVVSATMNEGVQVYLAHIGPTCPSRLYVQGQIPIGYRLLLWLAADGSVSVKAGYSTDPTDDVRCLLNMYRYHEPRAPLPMTAGAHRYTRDGVVDETALDTFTIDPATSKDFDDAISVDVANRTVYVHIVDIAAATLSEAEEQRMRERCLTLYLANEVTDHLLDEQTASHALSLVVGEPRQTVTVKAVLAEDNTIASYEIYRSTILVKRRYSYEEVDKLLETETEAYPALSYLKDITEHRSAVIKYNINLPSVSFQVDPETGLATTVETHATTTPAHQLVATAMIMANMLVSKHLHDLGVALPNRFHESLRGYDVSKAPITGDSIADSFILLKRYARACYKVDERGHFGLGLEHYIHFTSPMRRYADVIVHKLLAGYSVETVALEAEVEWINKRSYTCRVIQDLYEHWKVVGWLKRLPADRSPDVVVTSVSKAGVQWFMPSLSLNGFTHISQLQPKQFYNFNMVTQTLTGQTTGTTFGVGNKKSARLVSVDPVTAQPLLSLSD